MQGKLDIKSALSFIFGGNSTFTVVSKSTNNRYTFKVKSNEKGDVFFVSYLYNSDSYKFIGTIFTQGVNKYKYFPKKNTNNGSTINKTFDWVLRAIITQNEKKFNMIEFWHEGLCGQCGRKLTVPSSIESGFGPICSSKSTKNVRYKIRENVLDFLLNN